MVGTTLCFLTSFPFSLCANSWNFLPILMWNFFGHGMIVILIHEILGSRDKSVYFPTEIIRLFLCSKQTDVESQPLLQQQQQQQQMVPLQDSYMQSRAEALRNVESTIHELSNIFTQLATMVSQQGELAIRFVILWFPSLEMKLWLSKCVSIFAYMRIIWTVVVLFSSSYWEQFVCH